MDKKKLDEQNTQKKKKIRRKMLERKSNSFMFIISTIEIVGGLIFSFHHIYASLMNNINNDRKYKKTMGGRIFRKDSKYVKQRCFSFFAMSFRRTN